MYHKVFYPILRVAFSLLILNGLQSLAAILYDPSQLPKEKVYDYIIVGAGNAGGVVASRLAEDSSINVLVVEAGGDDVTENPISQRIPVPLMGISLRNSVIDWNFTTTRQRGLHNKSMHYVRGKVLGGSTTLNLMTYTRGSADDYDRLAAVTGDSGWSWSKLEPYMRKLEALTVPTDGHDTTGQILPSAHGLSGPLSISLPNHPLSVDDLIRKATQELSDRFPFNTDMNNGNPIGVGFNQATIRNGTRESVTTSYIRPALARGNNLDILLNSQVLRIVPSAHIANIPSFRTVQFARERNASTYSLTARLEVIVSCGAISTPHLLQLSGIGDATQLKAANIRPIVPLQHVGKNLQDHPLFTQPYLVNEGNDLDQFIHNDTFQIQALDEWHRTRKGIMGLSFSSMTGWLRSSALNSSLDQSAGSRSPHFAMIFTPTFVTAELKHSSNQGFLTISNIVASPASRGSVSIVSSDPWLQPAIDLNLLDSDFDIQCMKEAVRASQEFLEAPSLSSFVHRPFGGLADVSSESELEDYIRANTGTIHHAVGTARMSGWGSGNGVLNPDLTVVGTHGLRVVDACIFPFQIAAHPMGPVYIVAERGADIIKAARLAVQETIPAENAGDGVEEGKLHPSRSNEEL